MRVMIIDDSLSSAVSPATFSQLVSAQKIGDGGWFDRILQFVDSPFGQMILQMLLNGLGLGIKPADFVSAMKAGDGRFMKFLKDSGIGKIILQLLLGGLTGAMAAVQSAQASLAASEAVVTQSDSTLAV